MSFSTRPSTDDDSPALQARDKVRGAGPELVETPQQLRETIAALQEELAQLRGQHLALLENLRDIVLTFDPAGLLTSVAGNTIGVLGIGPYEVSAITADRWTSLVHPDDLPLVNRQLQACLERCTTGEVTIRMRDAAGEYRHVEMSLGPLLTEHSPEPCGVHAVARDVTDRVRSQRIMTTLNRAAEAVQAPGLTPARILEAVAMQLAELGLDSMVLLLEGDGESLRVAEARGAGQRMVAVEGLLRHPWAGSTLALGDAPSLRHALLAGRPECHEVTACIVQELLSAGERHLANAAATVLGAGRLIAAPMVADSRALGLLVVLGSSVHADLTPSVAAFANQTAIAYQNAQLLESLSESEEQYRGVFESVTDAITIFDEDGYILEANPAASRIYGYPHDELIGLHLSKIVHPDHYHGLANFKRGVQRDGSFHSQALNVRKDGSIIEVEVHGTSFRYKGQRRLLSVDTDITDRVRSHRALLRSEKLRALGQMAGGIAHDFNNLLLGIRGFISLALLELDEDVSLCREDLERALRSTGDAAEAVRRLQSLYRQADDTSDFGRVVLDELAREVLALTQPRWKDEPQFRGVTIDVIQELGRPPAVMGNAGELRRVLSNLVLNAVDAMPQGGRLTVATWSEDGHSVVAVGDTGEGMNEEQRTQLFEPFYTTKGTTGSGLGLTVSLSIVERHGGRIDVESEPAKGSTFIVRIPSAPAGEAAAPAPTLRAATGVAFGATLRVLAVDDEEAVLSVLARILEREGQQVVTASGGEEAIDLLREQPFDLLITDLGMPNVSGHQVAQQAHALHPNMPVILATGWGETISPEQLSRLGAVALLSKPYAYDDLLRAIQAALQGK